MKTSGTVSMAAPDSEDTNGLIVLEAGADAAGQRLDQWLAGRLGPHLSRGRVQALIRQGAVSVGGKVTDTARRKMTAGETVSVELPEPDPERPVVSGGHIRDLLEEGEDVVPFEIVRGGVLFEVVRRGAVVLGQVRGERLVGHVCLLRRMRGGVGLSVRI